MRRVAPIAVTVALAFVAPTALAAPPPDCKKVEAKKKKAGRTAQLIAVAKCHHDSGQFTAAWYEYTEAAARARAAKDKKSLKVAEAGERQNAGLLAWITVNPADKGAELAIDGEKTAAGAKKAVDPGTHTITAKGANRKPWSKTISLQSGDVEEVAVPAAEYDPSGSVESPIPGSTPPTPSSSAAPATTTPKSTTAASTTPGVEQHTESSDDDDDEVEPHTGFAADLDAMIASYEELSAESGEQRNGQAYTFLGQVAYDFDPHIRAFVRYGFIDNYAPGRAHAASVSNLLLGGSYGMDVTSFLRAGAEAGIILPTGTGGGTDPAEGIAVANARARSLPLHPTMFDPNFLAVYFGLTSNVIHRRIVGSLGVFMDPSFKVNDAVDEKMKNRLRLYLHGGYRVLPWLEPYAELRYFRFLSSSVAFDLEPTAVDNLFGGIGVAAKIGPIRAQVAYLRALDPPLTRIAYNVFAIHVGAEF